MLNVVALMGRLTGDPELRHIPSGAAVSTFSIAVDRTFVKQGADRQADFINIVCWDRQAEFVSKYFKKGQLIAVDGRIQTRRYDDAQGNKRTAFEVVAANVHFAENKKDSGSDVQYNEPAPSFVAGDDDFEEITGDDSNSELPF